MLLDNNGLDLREAEKRVKEKYNRENDEVGQYIDRLITQINAGEMNMCNICLEPCEALAITKCLRPHVFCGTCVKLLEEAHGNYYNRDWFHCPMCRHKLRKTDYRLFEKEDEFAINDSLRNTPSSKIRSILNKIDEILTQRKEKVVVFTQFKEIIGILEHNIHQMYGDGKALTLRGELNANQRTQVLDTYKTDPRASVLICSMKVGGVGLNLTNANHVIIVDPVTTNLFI